MELYLLIYTLMLSCFDVMSQTEKAAKFLDYYNDNYITYLNKEYEAMFTRAVNITNYNSNKQTKVSEEVREKFNEMLKKARGINVTGCDENTKRQFKFLLSTKTSANKSISTKLEEIGIEMKNIYSAATVPYSKKFIKSLRNATKELKLEQHLMYIMSTSTDPRELEYVWLQWRCNVGRKLKDLYAEYVKLNNVGAKENGYDDAGDYKRKAYEVDDLEVMAEDFLKDMQPFYLELHGYVRYLLTKSYPSLVEKDGLIPAHLLGSLWAQSWDNLYYRVIPYPNEPTLDVTPMLRDQHSITGMFTMAEEFFISLGWPKLPKPFWKYSLFIEPKDRMVECHASALDLKLTEDGEPDVRIKMCTKQTQRDFITIHHELGRIYYYLLYWNQSLGYRHGANPGFHEAVGDTITLSVQTPAHLNAVGLLEKISQTKEADINFLMKTALEGIPFLPYAFIMDKWMWNVYNGKITPDMYNKIWWQYRRKYQGIKSPVQQDQRDFDPGAKFHIPAGVPYIRYFFAYILQFTFHKKACKQAKNSKPLHLCSIYQSKEAGKSLGEMLALGRSKPWPEILKLYTGSDKISNDPIKEYFHPLIEWLQDYRRLHKYPLGWDEEGGKEKRKTASSANKTNTCYLAVILVVVTLSAFIWAMDFREVSGF